MLSIRDLSKTYTQGATCALDAVNLEIARGDFAALLGQNGAGKTTLLNILMGLTPPDTGTIHLDGEPLIGGKRHLKSRLGIVPQELVTDFLFTVEEVLTLYSGYYGIRKNRAQIDFLLERLSLADKRRAKISTLSGGMKRRLLVARALVHRPDILLLDEPTAGVDIDLRQEMYAFLKELHAAGTTIILTTHYLEEAEHLCDRIVMLKAGRLIVDKSKADFLNLRGDKLIAEVTFSRPLSVFAEKWPNLTPIESGDTRRGRFLFQKKALKEVLARLEAQKGDIEDLNIRSSRLEDVFLDLTHEHRTLHN